MLPGALLAVALALAVAASPAPAAPLCGIDADGVAAARAKVAADPRFKRDAAVADGETYASEALQAIWTFTTAGAPVHPAALCEQLSEHEGATRIERHVLCEAGPARCAVFEAEVAARDEGSGDGE